MITQGFREFYDIYSGIAHVIRAKTKGQSQIFRDNKPI